MSAVLTLRLHPGATDLSPRFRPFLLSILAGLLRERELRSAIPVERGKEMEEPVAIAKCVKANYRKATAPTKSRHPGFDRLVAHYYPAVYRFASRVADNHREAVVLTRDAFNSVKKRIPSSRDEFAFVAMLICIVIRAGKQ